MNFLIRNAFLLYAIAGTVVAGIYLVDANGSWVVALQQGGQEVLFGVLLIGSTITSGIGHLCFGEAVVTGQNHTHNDVSRMFQWELGVFTLIVAAVAMVLPVTKQTPLALAWGVFVITAGVRHAIKKEPMNTVVGDIWMGGLLVAACLPSLY
jgi:hypothetical protein